MQLQKEQSLGNFDMAFLQATAEESCAFVS